jgi:hypothetical protein
VTTASIDPIKLSHDEGVMLCIAPGMEDVAIPKTENLLYGSPWPVKARYG